MFLADLHTHTTASDGLLTSEALVERAAALRLNALCVTDHDTLKGTVSAYERGMERGLTMLCGVELSAGEDGETHVLGYGLPENAPALDARIGDMRQDRVNRAKQMCEKLKALSMPVDEARVLAANGSVGRPHVAHEMVRLGYVKDTAQAFDLWLGSGCPAYVPRKRLSVGEAIGLLSSARFVPVLAHPALLRLSEEAFRPLLHAWKTAGLKGLEVYHPANEGERGYAYYLRAARDEGLLVTGGSDFHCDGERSALGVTAQSWSTSWEDVEKLLAAVQNN